ncbi:hypothetical protein FA10DRAFT_273410 [Acaromyces ingoldii]|uniref:FUN34-transmembrane protein n=1 Tax=Acaromyces ingoldii TaxID=215250 RepID=A0A316YBQ2_9BASI|nr:hypothetical protein FA10DRAFT_273410 [Acaromyces ingoldii]PWN87210.1 hypothetical protein FA10DRAFT_273410 [Acaromyces ingoldii]
MSVAAEHNKAEYSPTGEPHVAPDYQGAPMSKSLTPGGHPINDDLIAVASSHRKIANPLPSGAYGFATTTLLLSFYNLHVAGIETPNGVLTISIMFGGLAQLLAGLWEFASGNTFGATLFVSYGCFWWGYSIIQIPFFGLTGTYDGQPNIYSAQGLAAAELDNAVGLFLWIWFGITTVCELFTFAMLAAHAYTGNASFEKAGGGLGVATAFVAYYVGTASFLTKNTSYFTLPVGDLSVKD